MYTAKLVFVLTLSIGCIADLACGDAIRKISEALSVTRFRDVSAKKLVSTAETFLEAQTKGVHPFNGDTVDLLKKFIAAGKAIQGKDCSENSHQLIDSLPMKEGKGYEGWQQALFAYKIQHDAMCSEKLQVSDKKLYSTLDRKQVDLISQITKIAIPIVREEGHSYGPRLMSDSHIARGMSRELEYFLNRLTTTGSKQFKEGLLKLFENNGQHLSVAESFEQYVSKPCQYYVEATSSIFEPQTIHYKDYDAGNEEFNRHFLGYQLCRFFEREKSTLLSLLEA